MKFIVALVLLLPLAQPVSGGEILHYADMNTREISALDAANIVVLLPGGILEEHGPYLPSGTDSLVSRHMRTRSPKRSWRRRSTTCCCCRWCISGWMART